MAPGTPKQARGGRRSLSIDERKLFALRFYAVLKDRCGSFEQFKKLLTKRGTKVREVTVRGWLPPLERLELDPQNGSQVLARDWNSLRTPDLPGLCEVAEILDVSIDYLAGYPVPKRRSEREPPGELARALLDHVVGSYLSRVRHQRRDGLANALGGSLTPGVHRRIVTDDEDTVTPGFRKDVGNPSLWRPLMLSIDDPQMFLAEVSDLVYKRAERWEEENREPEREAVRDSVRLLAPHVDQLANEVRKSRADVLRQLLDAALDPLLPKAQANVITLREDLLAAQQRAATDELVRQQLSAAIVETLREQGILEDDAPSSLDAKSDSGPQADAD